MLGAAGGKVSPDEIDRLKPGHLLFCYLHLAANPDLTRRLCDIGLTALAFETVVEEGVQHFCVTNMPGVVPRSASEALSAAMLPYLTGPAAYRLVQRPQARRGGQCRRR